MNSKGKRGAGLGMAALAGLGLTLGLGRAHAQDALIDDFEIGSSQNWFQSYWYFYNDSADGGKSKVNSATPLGSQLLFDPLVSLGEDEFGGKAAKIDYQMGPDPLSCGAGCTYGQFVGFGTDMTSTGDPLDLTGATKITYKAKADAPTTIVVQVPITSVTKQDAPQSFAIHQVTHNITTTWKTYEISLSSTASANALKQPSWAKPVIPFNPKEVEKISWKISMDAATNPTHGVVLIDSVLVKNYTWHSPWDTAFVSVRNRSVEKQGISGRVSQGILQVTMNLPAGDFQGRLELLDLQGRLVQSRDVSFAGGGREKADVHVEGQTKGLHFLRLRGHTTQGLEQEWRGLTLL